MLVPSVYVLPGSRLQGSTPPLPSEHAIRGSAVVHCPRSADCCSGPSKTRRAARSTPRPGGSGSHSRRRRSARRRGRSARSRCTRCRRGRARRRGSDMRPRAVEERFEARLGPEGSTGSRRLKTLQPAGASAETPRACERGVRVRRARVSCRLRGEWLRTCWQRYMRELAQQKAPPRPPWQKASSCALARTEGSACQPHSEMIAPARAATSGSSRQCLIDGGNAGRVPCNSAGGGASQVLFRVARL